MIDYIIFIHIIIIILIIYFDQTYQLAYLCFFLSLQNKTKAIVQYLLDPKMPIFTVKNAKTLWLTPPNNQKLNSQNLTSLGD